MLDELTPIAVYMAHEINTNAHGPDCRKMRELNASSSQACIAEYLKAPGWRQLFGSLTPAQCLSIEISSSQGALLNWALLVRQNGTWDHKPKIAARFRSAANNNYAWYRHGSADYYYDLWSNIHYGYIGIAAGFSESVLLDGAGLEQVGSDFVRRRLPKRSPSVQGLRSFDDEQDRVAIELGIELQACRPQHIIAQDLVKAILAKPGIPQRPAVSQ